MKVKVTMDSGAAGHVMLEGVFPRVKLERTNGEQIRDMGEKTVPVKTTEGTQRCITFRSASVVKLLISKQEVVRAGNIVDTIAQQLQAHFI